jgi:hypothetical protein
MKAWLTFVLFVSLQTIASANNDSKNDWLIDPANRVGKITKGTSKTDLINLYGKENVKDIRISVGEGMFDDGSVLFAGTKNELLIEWDEAKEKPLRMTLNSSIGSWWFSNGLKIGDSLKKITTYNALVFKLTGFQWDYPGRTVSWEKGKLSENLQLDFGSDKRLSQSDSLKVAGDGSFKSSNKVFKKMNLKVKTIFIRWDY